jgi:hypothetical protein
METPTVYVRQCISEAKGIVSLHQALFTIQTIDGNTDSLCMSMYSRREGNCSPPLGIVHYANHQWKHQQFVSIGVFQRQRELFLSSKHCSQSTTPRETSTVCVCRCIPKVRGIVPPFSYRWWKLLSVRFPRELLMECEFQCIVN